MKKEIEHKTRPVKYRKAVILSKEELFNRVNWIVEEKYHGKMTAAARKDIARLKKGEPVDYIIGFVEFLGCKIDLSKKPLIPRVETEFWVEEVINEIGNPSTRSARSGQNLRILDMFAGSGCIGIAALKHVPNAHVTFVDSEKNAIEQIKINTKINFKNRTNNERLQFVLSDVFENVKGKYNYIFANPPYIPTARKSKVQKAVLKYEPHEALFGGGDGMVYIRKFLASAKNFLSSNGEIYMEFDPPQKLAIEKLIKRLGYKKYEFYKDQFGKWRYVMIGL